MTQPLQRSTFKPGVRFVPDYDSGLVTYTEQPDGTIVVRRDGRRLEGQELVDEVVGFREALGPGVFRRGYPA